MALSAQHRALQQVAAYTTVVIITSIEIRAGCFWDNHAFVLHGSVREHDMEAKHVGRIDGLTAFPFIGELDVCHQSKAGLSRPRNN